MHLTACPLKLAATVEQLIDIFHATKPAFSEDLRPSLSQKSWTHAFQTINRRVVYRPTKASIDEFLGPDLDRLYRGPSEVDNVGLQNPAYPLNVAAQPILNEGDVECDFHQHFKPTSRLAFTGQPFMWPRSQAGPTGPTNTNVTVDYQLTWPGPSHLLERAAMIGELKQPAVIIPEEWTTNRNPSTTTQRLQREIRG